MRAFLRHGDGFEPPLSGGDQGLHHVRRQVLHADQPVGQRREIGCGCAGDGDEGGLVEPVERRLALGQCRGNHGADHIPVLQKDVRIDVAQILRQHVDLIRGSLRAVGHLLRYLLILLVRPDRGVRLVVVLAEGVGHADGAVL